MGEDARTYLFRDLKLKVDTILDFGELYKRLFSWFEVMDFEFYEKNYEKHDMGGSENIKIYWVAEKNQDAYVKFVIETNFFITGFQKVEIEKDGLKIKTNKCSMEIRMSAYMVRDPGDKLKKSVGNTGRRIYEKFIAKKRLDDMEVALYKDSHLLLDEIKAFASMHNY